MPQNGNLEQQKLRLPLLLALGVSPLILLSEYRWQTRDFARRSLLGVRLQLLCSSLHLLIMFT